jgi:hypothetical protein
LDISPNETKADAERDLCDLISTAQRGCDREGASAKYNLERAGASSAEMDIKQ